MSSQELKNNPDFLFTSDFSFQELKFPRKNGEEWGDSGRLFLGVNQNNPKEQYIIKHENKTSACNEYLYSKVGNILGINIAPVKLFINDDNNKLFKNDYICGIKYFPKCQKIYLKEVLEQKNNIVNWKDYFKYRGLEKLLEESDDIEVILADQYLYRIDTTASFTLSEIYMQIITSSISKMYESFIEEEISRIASSNPKRRVEEWSFYFHNFQENYPEYTDLFLEPFQKFIQLPLDDFSYFLDNLTKIYPRVIKDYFTNYFYNLKEDVKLFLKEIKK